MLALKDFYHLPQVDSLVERVVRGRPGLVVVAGLDPRPGAGAVVDGFLPSGRSTIFAFWPVKCWPPILPRQATLVSAQRDACACRRP